MKKNIALLTGGYSGELEVSIESGKVVFNHFDKDLFNVYTIVVGENKWVYYPEGGGQYEINLNDFSLTHPNGKVSFHAAFIAIHGTPGEDGKLQGYLDLMGIPYNTCGRVTSSVTFNKFFCNELAVNFKMNTAKTFYLHKRDHPDLDSILSLVGLPCFVKPNSNGSSVGISKVKSREELLTAISLAFEYDTEVLIQEFIPGVEITCGIYERHGQLVTLPLTEIVPDNDFFDYEAKYKGKAEEITPARISGELTKKCTEISTMLYRRLNCRGIVRFDYILTPESYDKGQQFYFLEVNTIPGLSEASIIPQQITHKGITLKQLFTDVISETLDNY
ncbi:MAG: D-alanine--D-alanine ligase [Lentimicrobium sp.]|nr:D-alanine--D-alanine ligase [Lentimicrobium sp.]